MTTTNLDPDQIVIGGTGTIYVAPENTPTPSHLSEALNAAFVALGYTTDDGAKFTDQKTVNDVRPWQSFYPVRVHVTERSGMVEFSLMQWNAENLTLSFGGGYVNQPRPNEFRYHPPSPEELAVVALVIDIVDGDRNFRLTTPRAFVTSNTESTFAKKGPALLPVTLAILANGDLDPWTMDTDDAAWAPAAS